MIDILISLIKLRMLISAIFIAIFVNISHANEASSEKAEQLINQNIQALGGVDALLKMQSISRYGRIIFYDQNSEKGTYCYHTDLVYSNKLHEQLKGKQIAVDRGTDGVSFWSWTGSQYEYTEDKKLINYMLSTAEHANREMLWVQKESDNFNVLSASPSWARGDNQCIQQIKSKNATKRIYCFDTATGLLNALGSDEEYRLESDWRRVGNIMLPFHLMHYLNGHIAYDVQLDHAELNKEIPDSRFTKPSSPQLAC